MQGVWKGGLFAFPRADRLLLFSLFPISTVARKKSLWALILHNKPFAHSTVLFNYIALKTLLGLKIHTSHTHTVTLLSCDELCIDYLVHKFI